MRARAARDARGLRIPARRDVSTRLTGAYRSAHRGPGLVFEELREYSDGEDAARIEWNATARLGRPIVKQMREERDLLLALLVDVSPSLGIGFGGEPKLDSVLRAAAALASAATRVQDRVALVTFARGVVTTLPPAHGPAQLERVFRTLEKGGAPGPTDAVPALEWAIRSLPRHSIVVLISDLLFPDPGAALSSCAHRHELLALQVTDRTDTRPPRLAPVRVRDAEDHAAALWRGTRGDALPLPAARFIRLGARKRVIHTGAELMPGLRRVFQERSSVRT